MSVNQAIHLTFIDSNSKLGFTKDDLFKIRSNTNCSIYSLNSVLPKSFYNIEDCLVIVIRNYFNSHADNLWQSLSTNQNWTNNGYALSYSLTAENNLNGLDSIIRTELVDFKEIDGKYYNTTECYKPLTRSSNREVGFAIGSPMFLQFCWFHESQQCSGFINIPVQHGDLYILSEVASGLKREKQTGLYVKNSLRFNT